MKFYVAIILLLICQVSRGQDTELQKQAIDSIVEVIDRSPRSGKLGFATRGSKPMLYRCLILHDQLVKISRRYSTGTDSVWQEFYIDVGQLVFATEKITTYLKPENVDWAARFYFVDEKLVHHSSIGHGKSESDDWKPEKEMKSAFEQAWKESMKQYIKRKPN